MAAYDDVLRVADKLAMANSPEPPEATTFFNAAIKAMKAKGVGFTDLFSLSDRDFKAKIHEPVLYRLAEELVRLQTHLDPTDRSRLFTSYKQLIAAKFPSPQSAPPNPPPEPPRQPENRNPHPERGPRGGGNWSPSFHLQSDYKALLASVLFGLFCAFYAIQFLDFIANSVLLSCWEDIYPDVDTLQGAQKMAIHTFWYGSLKQHFDSWFVLLTVLFAALKVYWLYKKGGRFR